MAALPYIQLYVADYLADTMHLTTEEHGAYLLIIFNYWQTGKPIPKNRLARIARLSNERWISVEASLAEFFNDNGTEWQHSRIDMDLQAVNGSLSQKSAAGKASAEARRRKKLAENQHNFNERSTGVEIPLKRNANEAPTNKDTDTDTPNGASASDTPNIQKPPVKSDYPDWFENIWQHYPPRSGGNDKRKAFHAAQARIRSGKDPDYLLQAVLRYAQFVRANGNWGAQYVMQAATFLGPGEHIDNLWSFNHAANQPVTVAGTSQLKPGFADVVRSQARQALESIDREAGDALVHANG